MEEWGAEAALAMLGTIGYGASRLTEVRADHPFLLSIRHRPSGASLFAAQLFALGTPPQGTVAPTRCYRSGGLVKMGLGAPAPRLKVTLTPSKGAEVTRRIVRRHVNELRYCVGRAARRGPTAATSPPHCRLTLVVGKDGRASATRAAGAPTGEVCVCMERAVRRWIFPASATPTPRTLDVRTVGPR